MRQCTKLTHPSGDISYRSSLQHMDRFECSSLQRLSSSLGMLNGPQVLKLLQVQQH